MIKIKIPNNNINERKHIIDIIFNEFLGLEYSLEVGLQEYEVVWFLKIKQLAKEIIK